MVANSYSAKLPAIETEWVSTPALWSAYRSGQCFCEECRGSSTVGFGKTEQAAIADLQEQEEER